MSQAMLDLIRKRRTIRQFTDEDVSQEQIETLLEMAMCAPNRLDRQPWHFIVIRDMEMKKYLAETLRVYNYLEQAPVVVAVCGLPEVSPTWIMDVTAAAENVALAATAIGLGVAWVGAPGTVMWDRCEEAFYNALHVQRDGVRIPLLLAIGHPAEELPPHGKHDRFDPARVHYDKW